MDLLYTTVCISLLRSSETFMLNECCLWVMGAAVTCLPADPLWSDYELKLNDGVLDCQLKMHGGATVRSERPNAAWPQASYRK